MLKTVPIKRQIRNISLWAYLKAMLESNIFLNEFPKIQEKYVQLLPTYKLTDFKKYYMIINYFSNEEQR